jgi:hypothetical protein
MPVTEGKYPMKRLLLARAMTWLLSVQTANAAGCLKGAALGAVAGHMAHHTFLRMCGYHLYVKWKKDHPNDTMNEFVADNKSELPAGWAERLSSVGNNSNV